jgi:hypothetical protein
LFSNLFSNQKQTLWKMVSRRHCRVTLGVGEPPEDVDGADQVALQEKEGRSTWLLVENLSVNSISVDGEVIAQGKRRIMTEGAKIVFVQTTNTEHATNFLAFRLRRARIVKNNPDYIPA